VLCADAIDDIDYTGGQTLLELADHLEQRGIVFAVAEADDDIRRELDRFGLTARIGPDRYFTSLHDARDAFHATTGSAG
jgi:MFS superfamily sulfate permease-like transporter